jgi:hypothetical protein
MPQSWQVKYMELVAFVREHEEIIIEPSRMRIPAPVRSRFYELFEAVRTAFLEGNIPEHFITDSSILSLKYIEAENDVISLLDLEKIAMMPSLSRFLHDPVDQIKREIYDPLLNLVKRNISIPAFETTAIQNINRSFAAMFQMGYEKWVTLSLVKLLEPDEALYVPGSGFALIDAQISGGVVEGEIAPPKMTKSITFESDIDIDCNTADFIMHSIKTGRYFSSRGQFGRPFYAVTNASQKREWYTVDSVPNLRPGLILIDQGNLPRDISLFGDARKICRPDIVLMCYASTDWFEKNEAERVRACHRSLNPIRGTFVVSLYEVPDRIFTPDEGISLISAGFDSSRLGLVMDALLQAEEEEHKETPVSMIISEGEGG